jgi:uncharacterized membrane protein YheB (UPF0754 family)
LFSAFIGWFTNVIAVEMMFYPIDFVGIPPVLGWQGIVPAHAKALAARSTDLITTKLINLKTLLEQFDAEGFAGNNLDQALDELADQVIRETAETYASQMWASSPEVIKQQVRGLVRTEVQALSVKILADISANIEDMLELKPIVVDAAHRDRRLIGNMFQTTGRPEFVFIKRSGAYFGFLFGIVQLGAWIVYPAWWVLPFFGFFVGYATNWLAIKLIFEPAEPKRFGPFVFQGLFHKRQAEVAQEFAHLVSKDILNVEAMVGHMITGASGERLFGIVERHVNEMLERYKTNPLVGALVPADKWDAVQGELGQRIRDELPKPGGFLHIFVGKAVDVYSELFERMTQLDSESFEGVLRPAFQKDEWKLIVAGAVLGFGAGLLQLVFVFGDSVL